MYFTSNFSFIWSEHTHTYIGLLFGVGAAVAAVAFVVVVDVFAVDELSSMLCFIPKRKKERPYKRNEDEKDDGWFFFAL